MIRKINLEITYEISGKLIDSIHSFYMLDAFISATRLEIENKHNSFRDDLSMRITKSVDKPTDIYK